MSHWIMSFSCVAPREFFVAKLDPKFQFAKQLSSWMKVEKGNITYSKQWV